MAGKPMGEMISTLRREKGMTQKELADKLNITDKAVSKWERDITYPDTQTIPKLADIFGVSVDDLLGRNWHLLMIRKNLRTLSIVPKASIMRLTSSLWE